MGEGLGLENMLKTELYRMMEKFTPNDNYKPTIMPVPMGLWPAASALYAVIRVGNDNTLLFMNIKVLQEIQFIFYSKTWIE